MNVGNGPTGVVATPDGTNVYVVNYFSNNICVIDTINSTVTAMVNEEIILLAPGFCRKIVQLFKNILFEVIEALERVESLLTRRKCSACRK